jgi:SAM-dependent methyltransferase
VEGDGRRLAGDGMSIKALERIAGDHWLVVRKLIGEDTLSVLDVGCRDRALLQHLPTGSHYVGLDLVPPADVIASADEPLPFEEDSFETVVLADVLEHLNDPHTALDEAMRVARTAVVVLLPNMYTLYYRLRFVAGRLPGDKYTLGAENPRDRHRWLPSLEEAARFTRGRAQEAGWCVALEYAYDRQFHRPSARFVYWAARIVGNPGLWSWEYAARLEPRGHQ